MSVLKFLIEKDEVGMISCANPRYAFIGEAA